MKRTILILALCGMGLAAATSFPSGGTPKLSLGVPPTALGALAGGFVQGMFDWLGVSGGAQDAGDPKGEVVDFPDAALAGAVREALGIPSDQPILDTDLIALVTLSVVNGWHDQHVADLTGAEHCINLVQLDLGYNLVSDLAPLAHLAHLSVLKANANQVSDAGPLAGIASLTELALDGNGIEDLTPVANLTNLTTLNVSGCNVRNIDPLSGLANLTTLQVAYNEVSDIGGLRNLTNLGFLDLNSNQVAEITALVDNPGIGAGDQVDLHGNPLSAAACSDAAVLEARGATVIRDEPCEPTTKVLFYWDSCGGGQDYVTAALTHLGLTDVTKAYDTGRLIELIYTQPWDLVVVDSYSSGVTEEVLTALTTYYDLGEGRRIVFFAWNLSDFAWHPFATRAGVAVCCPYTVPESVYSWGSSPLFATPNAVSDLTLFADTCNTDGQQLDMTSATAHAGYTNAPMPNQAAISVDVNQRLIVNAFAPQLAVQDADSDGRSDMEELYENEIAFLLGITDDDLRVVPATGLTAAGPTGGPFVPSSKTYALSNKGLQPLVWTAFADQPWLDVAPQTGSLDSGESAAVTVTLNAQANALPPGEHAGAIVFTNEGSGVSQRRSALVTVTACTGVTPTDGFTAAGVRGGPFTPSNKTYTLTNPCSQPLDWTAAAHESWLDVSPAGGTLMPQASVGVTVSLNANANDLSEGNYSDTVTFTDASRGATETRPVLLAVETIPANAFLWFMLDTDPGWTTQGQWAFGVPQGHGSGYGDPLSGHTGANVYGYNLFGDYENSIPQYCLTTNALDCTGYEGVHLRFWRWLGVESASFDSAAVEVSNDGTAWTPVWTHTGYTIDDGAWVECDYDISSVADDRATVYVRWAMGPTDYSVTYPGWNIDDVALTGTPLDDLRIRPAEGLSVRGQEGGPFTPSSLAYALTNTGGAPLDWTASVSASWCVVVPDAGAIDPGRSTTATLTLSAEAASLPPGRYNGQATFTNGVSGVAQTRPVALEVLAIAGDLAVTDSIAPADDRSMPFGSVVVGLSRREHITVTNQDPGHDLIVAEILLGGQYREDFNDGQAQDWVEITDAYWAPVSGAYRAQAGATQVRMQSTYAGQRWGDCTFQATLWRSGYISSMSGLVLRASEDFSWAQTQGSAYIIAISGDGYYYVGKLVSGVFSMIEDWTFSTYLNTDTQPNVVRVILEGSAMSVSLNGSLAWSGIDGDIDGEGRIGLACYSGYDSETIHYFDDISVGPPESSTGAVDDRQQWYNVHAAGNGSPDAAPRNAAVPRYPGPSGAAGRQGGFDVPVEGPSGAADSLSGAVFRLEQLPALPATVKGGESFTFDVVYAPGSIAEHASAVTIRSNDFDESEAQVALSGRGVPDDLGIAPAEGLSSSGHPGGPFTPDSATYTLTNGNPSQSLSWRAYCMSWWLTITPNRGVLGPGDSAQVTVAFNGLTLSFDPGLHRDTVSFVNTGSSLTQTRPVALDVFTSPEISVQPDSMRVTLLEGQEASLPLTIGNSGDADLHFALRGREIGRSVFEVAAPSNSVWGWRRSPVVEAVSAPDAIELEYVFDDPACAKQGGYSQLSMQGLESYERVGAPIVPVRPAAVLVPFGKQVVDVRVTAEDAHALPGAYHLPPGQLPHPLSRGGPIVLTPPDPAIYAQNAPWPGKDYEAVTTQFKRGYQIFVLNLFPIQYVPASGAVTCAGKMRVQITLADAKTDVPVRPTDDTRAGLEQRVDNPSALATYPRQGVATPWLAASDKALPPGGPYEYVIITNAALAAATGPDTFQTLRDARIAEGHNATIVSTEWIYANYDGTRPDHGTDNPTRIRNFIADAYRSWGTRYVLLGGNIGIIPARMFWVDSFAGEIDQMPVDMYYGCVDPIDCTFDQNANGIYGEPYDGVGGGDVDLAAEVYVGRAPIQDATEMGRFVHKTLAYDSTPNEYLDRVSMVGEYLGFGGISDYATAMMEQIRLGSSDDGYTTVGFANHTQPDFFTFDTSQNLYDAPGFDWSPAQLFTLINNGVHVINHLGHSNQYYCAKVNASDLPNLANPDYFFVYSQGCEPGWFDAPDCFAEVLTTIEHGAFGAVMNARFGWGSGDSTDGPSQRFNRRFWDAVLAQRFLELGRANQDSKEDNLWDINGSCIRWCYYELNLFGDPLQEFRFQEKCEWLLFSQDSGTLPPGATVEPMVTFSTGALAPGVYEGQTLVRSDDRDTPVVTVPVTMTIRADDLTVQPKDPLASSGPQGGPYSPKFKVYVLTNTGSAAVHWNAVVSDPWVQVVPSVGTLQPGGLATVGVSLNAAAQTLAIGVHSGSVTFTNVDSGHADLRGVTLNVTNPLEVSPAEDFSSEGIVGGPFSPDSKIYSLTNKGLQPLVWRASTAAPWLAASPDGGTLNPGASITVTATLTDEANTLAGGVYTDAIVFLNANNGASETRDARVEILSAVTTLPFEETFESGILSPYWKLTGTNTYRTQISTLWPHAGTWDLLMDSSIDGSPSRNEATLVLDLAGYEHVVLAFWAVSLYDEPHGPPPSPFIGGADFDGVAISQDGNTWYEIQGLRGLPDFTYVLFQIDLDAAVAEHGLSYTRVFRVRFNHFDDYTATTDGIAIDDITVTGQIKDDLRVAPETGFEARGQTGGPFSPSGTTYTLSNSGGVAINWTATTGENWVNVAPSAGLLGAGESVNVAVSLNEAALLLAPDSYADILTFTNANSGVSRTRPLKLHVAPIAGHIAVTDSVAPEDDLAVPFGEVPLGDSRIEHITVTNTDAAHDLVVSQILLNGWYFENFEDGLAQGWLEAPDADWQVVSGEYRAQGTPQTWMQSTYASMSWQDCDFQATVRRMGSVGNPAILFVRASEDFSFVYETGSAYGVAVAGNGEFYVARYASSGMIYLQPWSYSAFLNQGDVPNAVRIVIQGTAIRVYFNDQLAWAGIDSIIAGAGRIGLGAFSLANYDPVYYFDNAMVGAPDASAARLEIAPAQQWSNAHPIAGGTPSAAPPLDVVPEPASLETSSGVAPLIPVFRAENLPELPATLAPGASFTFDVAYAPIAAATDMYGVRIMSNDPYAPEVEVVLSGTGYWEYVTVLPANGIQVVGPPGGPFAPSEVTYTVTNRIDGALSWSVGHTQPWLDVYPAGGLLMPDQSVDVTVSLSGVVFGMPMGRYVDTITFECPSVGVRVRRDLVLSIDALPPPAAAPKPRDGAVGWNIAGGLAWGVPEPAPLYYDVYLDAEDWPSTLACDALETAVCDPGVLAYDTLYHWQVVTRNLYGATFGPIWSFRTRPADCDEPVITEQPASQTACPDSPVSFSVLVAGVPPLSYQWAKDGVEIPGATGPLLEIAAASTIYQGWYACSVYSGCGSVDSNPACLSLGGPPAITMQPLSVTVCPTQTVMFSVVAEGSPAPLSYQWNKDGADIAGANADTLVIVSAEVSDAGCYVVVVSNACGSVTSQPACLAFNDPPMILEQPASETVCIGATPTFRVTAAGTQPLFYLWTFHGMPIPGATDAAYTMAPVSAADQGNYACLVANICGKISSNRAPLVVNGPPAIVTNPVSQTVCRGAPLSLRVEAGGSAPLSYQWAKDGNPLPGATNAEYAVDAAQPSHAGAYVCEVTNACGGAISQEAGVVVNEAAEITLQPISRTSCLNDSAEFRVEAAGTPPLSYQWSRNGASIPGATDAAYAIAAAQTVYEGCYVCTVGNGCGRADSAMACLTVHTPPAILELPKPLTVCSKEPVSFNVTASGTPPLSYQWKKDGADVPDATTDVYTIDSTKPEDAGDYTCVIANACGSETSEAAALTVNVPPIMTTAPLSATVCQQQPVTFEVSATGTAPLSYQWRKNGADIAGATAASYALSSAQPLDAGGYTCLVSNACGSVLSPAAALAVRQRPSITVHPSSQTVCPYQPVRFSVAVDGAAPLSYQWSKDDAEIPGATDASCTIVFVSRSDAGIYRCAVSNDCGAAVSEPAALVMREHPAITVQPVARTVCPNESVTFDIVATGAEPLSYQWRKNGVDVVGATDASYVIAAAQEADQGAYTCAVESDCGNAYSEAAPLTVRSLPAITASPVSQAVCENETVQLTVTATGSGPLSYQWSKDGTEIPGAANATYAIMAAQQVYAGSYSCKVWNACADAASVPAELTVNTPPMIALQPAAQTVCSGNPIGFTVVASGTAPLRYQWRHYGADLSGATEAAYVIPAPGTPHGGEYACVVSNACGSVTSDLAVLMVNEPPCVALQPVSQSVTAGAPVSFCVSVLGTPPFSYQWIREDVAIPDATADTYTIASAQPDQRGRYACRAVNECGSIVSDTALLTVNEPVMITQQPLSRTVIAGEAVSFTIEAAGTEPFSYQWQKDGLDVAGATVKTYTIAPARQEDAGSYVCIVRNVVNSVSSDAAALIVNDPVVIVEQPVSQTVRPGDSVTFSLIATGTQPLSYQWNKGSDPIPGATEPAYTIASASIADAAAYACAVSNVVGTVNSRTVTLTLRCRRLYPPGGVQATDGDFTDRVRVTWDPATDAAGYLVFRATDVTATAELLTLTPITETTFDDTTALPPTIESAPGCFGGTNVTCHRYTYWVKTVNACNVPSDFSFSDEGWVGRDKSAGKGRTVFEKALPSAPDGAGVSAIQRDSGVFIRLRSTDGIDVDSVWGVVTASDREDAEVAWLSVDQNDSRDGWAVYRPQQPWLPGDLVTFRVGASTLSGDTLEPIAYQFRVESEPQTAAKTVPQPAYAELDTRDMDLSAENNDRVTIREVEALPLEGGQGAAYAVGRGEAYETPQRVWLPLPAEEMGIDLSPYYYYNDSDDVGWYPAEHVEGWLVPDSFLKVELNGTAYLGFLVRHSGVVRLAFASTEAAAIPAQAGVGSGRGAAGTAGDLLFAGAVVVLLSRSRGKGLQPLVCKAAR